MTAPLTQLAGAFVADAKFEDVPEKALATARLGFTDTLASLLAGLNEPVTGTIKNHVEAMRETGGVEYLLGLGKCSAEKAALIDATSAHALDYDDYMFSNHISAVLVPALLAVARQFGADGRRMVTAYVVAYEVWGDLMLRESDHMYEKGWHPTAVLGPVGAAVAAAHILGLDAEKATNAIALSASHSGGLMANFGSMAKAYHAGRAAEAGVRSAMLAASGFTARSNALEDPRGLMRGLTPHDRLDLDTKPQYGSRWRSAEAGLNIKKFPTVGASQRCIDAVLALQAENRIEPKNIASINARVSEKFAAVMPFADPKTPAEAKFSLPFACAAGLRFGKVGLAEVSDEGLADRELRRLIHAVTVDAVDESDPAYPNAAPFDIVTVTLNDGTTIESPKITRASGHADKPLSTGELWTKFLDCASWGGVAQDAARKLFESAQIVETVSGPDAFLVKYENH